MGWGALLGSEAMVELTLLTAVRDTLLWAVRAVTGAADVVNGCRRWPRWRKP